MPDKDKKNGYIKHLVSHTVYPPLYRGNIYWNLSEHETLVQYAIDHVESVYQECGTIRENLITHDPRTIEISLRAPSALYTVIYTQEISHGMSCSSDTIPVEFVNWRYSTICRKKLTSCSFFTPSPSVPPPTPHTPPSQKLE
jgi:hypothetical protein